MPNPFRDNMGWYWWTDKKGLHQGPYNSEAKALRDLLRHMNPPPTKWERFKALVSEFIHS